MNKPNTATPKPAPAAPAATPAPAAPAPVATAPAPAPSAPTSAPPVRALSPAQRAAITRAANKAGIGPGITLTSAKAAPSDRAAGLILDLVIAVGAERLELSFRPLDSDGKPFRPGLGEMERALPDLAWHAVAHRESGELFGYDLSALRVYGATAARIERALPLMKRADKFLAMACQESEDSSFAFTASTLATHFRASRVILRSADGTETEHKRGAAYVTAHRASESLLASMRAPAKAA